MVFDIFRILRRSFKTPNFVTYIEDALFWIVSALIVLYSLFTFNNGEIRAYIFVGVFSGIVLYMLFLSKTIVKVSVSIILFIKKIVYAILKVVIYPIKVILDLLKKIFNVPYKFLCIAKSKTKDAVKNCQKLKIKSKNRKNLENKEGF